MPLGSIPDPFGDALHCTLDAAVAQDMAEDGMEDRVRPRLMYATLLACIVNHSAEYLNPTYMSLSAACTLLTTYHELQDMLRDAWTRKSFREIRCLAILQGLKTTPNYADPVLPDVHHTLSKCFELEYQGIAVDALYQHLTHCKKLFSYDPRYIAKICPVVQSSGTGKSRLLLELHKKGVIVLYMNLRERHDFAGFPARDNVPSAILTDFPGTRKEYSNIYYAFLTALFVTLEEQLATFPPTDHGRADIKHWVEQMCNVSYPPKFTARDEFFAKVTAKYLMLHARLIDPNARFFNIMDAYQGIRQCLWRIFPERSNEPLMVIAIDEAQSLATERGLYRPIDVVYELANQYHGSDDTIWVVLASTASGIADYEPPKYKYSNSARMAWPGDRLFSPYVQFGWSQNAVNFGGVSVDDISKLWHIASHGRLLWDSLLSVPAAQSTVITTASFKICGGKSFDPEETGHILAVLGQRFEVNIKPGHPYSITHMEDGIANHLRICHEVPMSRCWKFTAYPCEPLLSCVAAHHLHNDPHNLESALMTLTKSVCSDLVDLGQRGELTSRLLWLLAKDLYIRNHLHESSEIVTKILDGNLRDAKVTDCQMIPVIGWLEFIFGEQIWDKAQGSLIRGHFQDAFLNFSHWISMTDTIAGSGDDDVLELCDWTARLWQRTTAVQCCSSQPLVDQMIPIYFKESNATAVPNKQRASQIFIHHEARKYPSSRDHLSKITRKDSTIDPRAPGNAIPYIVILADLGQHSKLEVTYNDSDRDDCCLRIYAAGLDATIYPFLSNRPGVLTALGELVQQQRKKMPTMAYVDAQMKFGSSALPGHMNWEHGSSAPDLRSESEE